MNIAIGFIVIASLITISIKELTITIEPFSHQNLRKFLNIVIFVLVTLFTYLLILSIIEILATN